MFVRGSDNIVAATTERIFADLADPQTVIRAGDRGWMLPLWRALSDAGLTLACVPERHGGAGGSIADAFAVLGIAGRFAAGVPLAETLLAGWLLSRAGIASPAAAMSVAPARPGEHVTLNSDGTLTGRVRAVPFAREVGYLAVLASGAAETSIALVETAACRVTEGYNLAGDALQPGVVRARRAGPGRAPPG